MLWKALLDGQSQERTVLDPAASAASSRPQSEERDLVQKEVFIIILWFSSLFLTFV